MAPGPQPSNPAVEQQHGPHNGAVRPAGGPVRPSSPPAPPTVTGRIPITDVTPVVEGGQHPAKTVRGAAVPVEATIFRDGHDKIGANVVVQGPRRRTLGWIPMEPGAPGTDRWSATVRADTEGAWTFQIEAWSDPVATWRHAALIKVEAGIDVELMLTEGALLLERAARNLPRGHAAPRQALRDAVRALRDTERPPQARLAPAVSADVRAILHEHPLRELITRSEPYPLWVDRERALFGSWYEFFPRSVGAYFDADRGHWVSGTFATAAARLPEIADLGFDVVYLPPIHPVGRINRKGPNNTLNPGPADPGSPWAIGAAEGGHDAVHPDLGTIEDFDAFVARARELGLEVALDLALQAAPDHPWVSEHPDWFTIRADGSIAYAENPPKKYQDIYPLNFDHDPAGLYHEVLRVVRHWIDHGVRIFRVDNPHTKPVRFWEWLFTKVAKSDPDVIFLAEAFTRPPMMHALARVGFHQSYTYFTWRNDKDEITDYLRELAQDTGHFLRPNFFVNTPDILTEYLQHGGPPAFKIRAVLAAMSSPTWGVYSGYELFEHVAVRPGSEEYLDSEKYQYRPRDFAKAEAEGRSLAPYLRQLNEIRRAHPALRQLRNLTFHEVPEDHLLAFSKREVDPTGNADTVIVILNLDPDNARESVVSLTMPELGLDWHDTLVVRDELTGEAWHWGQTNYIRLDPAVEPAHILSVRP